MTIPLQGSMALDMTLGTGADVIRLEGLLIGDPGRYLHSILGSRCSLW